jgi:hypothetical protein
MAALILPSLLLFEPRRKDEAETEVARGATEEERREERLFCATCRKPVTRESERIAVNGAHTHRFTNPLHLSFRIGCFREAAGCRDQEPATTEHTWFPGYAWRVALCAHCQAHLGWRYEGNDGGFYGLILGRLVSVAGN